MDSKAKRRAWKSFAANIDQNESRIGISDLALVCFNGGYDSGYARGVQEFVERLKKRIVPNPVNNIGDAMYNTAIADALRIAEELKNGK